ncbi:MAG: YlmC/YmxH family sporulation protein [Oscillospiraceae bacterium]|nr:YlmC/YmxH family sporulation protein [Oscillospiraceae bacterium]
MDTTINDLRWKEVICVTDGTRYGYVGDMVFDLESGQAKALVVPGRARFFGLFGPREDKVFPWNSIRRFGQDIILVDGLPVVRGKEKKPPVK